MSNPWYGLLANLGVIVLFISAWTHLQDRIERLPSLPRSIAPGLLMGASAIAAMSLPFRLGGDMFVDLRTTPIVLAGFFGGPISGLTAGAAGALYRLYCGGGWVGPGLFAIGVSTIIGAIGHFALDRRQPRSRDVALLAAAQSVACLLNVVILPGEVARIVMSEVAMPLCTLVFAATLMSGLAILRESNRRTVMRANLIHGAIIQALPDCLNAKDLEGRFIAANPATARLMQAQGPAALIERSDFDFYPPDIAAQFRQDELRVLSRQAPETIEQHVQHRDGSSAWLSTLKAPLRDRNGEIIGLITHNRDITESKALETALAQTRQRLADALAHMADGLVMFDSEGRLVFCNEQYRAMFPKTADLRLPGTPLKTILRAALDRGEETPSGEEGGEAWIEAVYAQRLEAGDREIRLDDGRWLDARTRPTEDGGCLIVFSEITHKKQAESALSDMNRHLEMLARTDALTGLVNRRGFDDALAGEFARAARGGGPLTLMLIDVDRFKAFNDLYGHPAGDECLRAISRSFRKELLRSIDVAARYGGEELAAVLPGTPFDAAAQIAERFRLAVRALAIEHKGSEQGVVTVSIGVATVSPATPVDGPRDLVERADQALYSAKSGGRDRIASWNGLPTVKDALKRLRAR